MSQGISRRDFVKLCGAFSLALAAPLPLVPLAEAAGGPGRFRQTRLKMGTLVTLTLLSDSRARAEEALGRAWEEMDRLVAVFDRHRPGTPVSELNASGFLPEPPPEMLEVLRHAARVHRVSGGAFDPSVLPLLNLIAARFKAAGRPPEAAELTRALARVDFGAVGFGRAGVRLGRPGQELTLDGVAKGYIVDRVGERLRASGIKRALLNAGGDLLALGCGPGDRPWRVAVRNPFDQSRYLRVIGLCDQAVATSGSYEVFFDPDHEYHHLLNPATGRPAERLISATLIAPAAARADAFSTAAFVRPEIAGSIPGLEALLVTRTGAQKLTPGFKGLLVRS